jgi:hypothetical protein
MERRGTVRWMFRVVTIPLALLFAAAPAFLSADGALAGMPSFSCGPHALTFLVKPRSEPETECKKCGPELGDQISCAVIVNGPGSGSGSGLTVVFFTEGTATKGQWYRYMGFAQRAAHDSDDPAVYAANIYGNGETVDNVQNGGTVLHVAHGTWDHPLTIDEMDPSDPLGDAGRWTLESDVAFSLHPAPHVCGIYYAQYSVTYGSHSGSGIRCVFQLPGAFAVWYGAGTMDGQKYTEIGYHSAQGYGAVDLCDPAFGTRCMSFPAGSVSLKFKKVLQSKIGVTMKSSTGLWSETWVRHSQS